MTNAIQLQRVALQEACQRHRVGKNVPKNRFISSGMKYKRTALILAAAAVGFASIIAPIFFLPVRAYDAPLFPWVRTAIENLGLVSLLLLVTSGIFFGLISSAKFWLLGFSMIALFPLSSILEGIADPHFHRLFGLELCVYAVLGFIASAAVLAGQKFKFNIKNRRRVRRGTKGSN